DDLLLGNHLGDLVVVAEAVLETHNHRMVVDHGQGVADGCLQILVVDEHHQQVHHADPLGIGGGHGGTDGDHIALPLAGNPVLHQNAVLADGLNHRGRGVQCADLVILHEIAG